MGVQSGFEPPARLLLDGVAWSFGQADAELEHIARQLTALDAPLPVHVSALIRELQARLVTVRTLLAQAKG